MKIKHLLTLSLVSLVLYNCQKEIDQPQIQQESLPEITPDLTKGITPYLSQEEISFFQGNELEELDLLVMKPEQILDFRSGNVVEVPADSEDALAAAIVEAGEGGTVILKAGMHTESASVVIPYPMTLRGEEGAILEVDSKPAEQIGFSDPGIYVIDADNVRIIGIQLQSKDDVGGTGILLQNSHYALVSQNNITRFQAGVGVSYSNNARIIFNKISTPTGWQTGEILFSLGIFVPNGKNTRIIGNDCSNSVFGLFASDKRGFALANKFSQNFYGLILCKLISAPITTPDGQSLDAELSAQNWLIIYNSSSQNLAAGYLVIDGANANYLNNNFAENNGSYDIELAGPSERFGFPTPACFNNRVFVRSGQSVKDCGDNNHVRGGVGVDTDQDPCS